MTIDEELRGRFEASFDALAAIGHTPASGWRRFAWTPEDLAARRWFADAAATLGLGLEQDRNGNLWAWWGGAGEGSAGDAGGPAGAQAVVTGSHLDTVPGGGPFDGALGVVSGFIAIEMLQRRGVRPTRPVAVTAFGDEEGGRFGLATFGSRLAAGLLQPADVLERRDADGNTLAEALTAAGVDPAGLGADAQRLERVGAFVELHIEQGRALVDQDVALAVGTGIWPHGRWRLEARGEQNHAGTTRMLDRRDPMHVLARAVEAADRHARAAGAVATVGHAVIEPNGTNSVPGSVNVWLDARAADEARLDALVDACISDVREAAQRHGLELAVTCESRSAAVAFDEHLRTRMTTCLATAGLPSVALPTAAGHDAGALASRVPTGMLFVRNPTGVSHSPFERATVQDCLTGIEALAAVIEELACRT